MPLLTKRQLNQQSSHEEPEAQEIYQRSFFKHRILEITPVDTEEARRYAGKSTQIAMGELKRSIADSVISQLRSECEQADKKMMEDWENDVSSVGFKLDHMTAELLIHILQNAL